MRIIDSKIRAKIGAVVRTNRLAHNMSQDELARKSGITRMFVNQIENGKRIPSIESLTRIASCLNQKVLDLLEEATLGEVDERVALTLNLRKVLETEDVAGLRKLLEYAKTLKESR
jgi:transcriptional regulator with XRE-family HTH domain